MPPKASDPAPSIVLHATTVDFAGQGLLIVGASGSGKSALALQLMAAGATLVSDDGTRITQQNGAFMASAPTAITGLIEARGIGILRASHTIDTQLALAVDMDQEEPERFPPPRRFLREFVSLPCLYKVNAPHFGAGIIQFLKGGRQDTT